MKEPIPTDLQKRLEWLELVGCTCPHAWRPLGALYGIRMGYGWVRLSDGVDCPHHARAAA